MVANDNRDAFRYDVAFVRSDMRALVAEIEAEGVPVHDLGARGDFELAWLLRLRQLLLDQRYDVMHSHSPYAAGLARIVTRTLPKSRRPRLVCTEHSLWSHDTTPSRLLGRTTSQWDDVRIAVAETNRADLPASLRRRTRVIRHGIDLSQVRPEVDPATLRASLGIPADHQIIVSVANLRPQKGYPTLLQAARRMIDRGFRGTFLAAGSGPLEAELRQEHASLGLGDQFRFLGQRSDATSLIAMSDVMVLSSDWECMPVAVMEAFALGTPVVATSVGELPLVIVSGVNGILVPPGEPEALASALEGVLADPGLSASLAAAAADTADTFDVRTARREVEGVYAELVSR